MFNRSFLSLLLMTALPLTGMPPLILYVASPPVGHDANPGTAENPLGSLEAAARAIGPGGTIRLKAGIHRIDRPVRLSVRGTADAWITIEAFGGGRATLDASDWHPGPDVARSLGNLGALHLEDCHYLRIRNIEVRNSHGAGIMVNGPGAHIDIIECRTEMTFAPGIGAWNMEHLRILECEVTRANDPAMRLYGNPDHECPHEAISVAGVAHFEVARNHVHHSIKEGIDVKEISRHGVVHHNHVHDMGRQGLYVDAWFGHLFDVEFSHNRVHDCEWGLALSVEGKGSMLSGVRIHHNLLYRNRGSGIYFGTWGGDGPRSDIRITNNTIVGNGDIGHWAGPTGSIDMKSANTRDVLIARNICLDGAAFDLATFIDPAAEPDRFAALNIRIEDNLLGPFRDETDYPSPYNRVHATEGLRPVRGDPKFADPSNGDFHPLSGSAAITEAQPGYLGAIRPRDTDSGSEPATGG